MASAKNEEMKKKASEFVHRDDEPARIEAWNRKMLKGVYTNIGYRVSAKTIDKLIASKVSHHDLLSLLERGCPVPLCARILA